MRRSDPEAQPGGGDDRRSGPRLVVIGGSAGAHEPLTRIVAGLPADFPATVLVTIHLPPSASSALPRMLDRAGPLPARHPRHGEPLQPATILIAPPDRHLVVRDDVIQLSRGPRENRHRPAVDALFNSAARWHGPAVIGVVLSGALDDGAAGAAAVAAQDGIVVVQDPAEATCTGMPDAARSMVRRALTVPAEQIAPLLDRLVRQQTHRSLEGGGPLLRWEEENMTTDTGVAPGPPGSPVALGCPECQGGMFESTDGNGIHYLCHVGHSWSPETLISAQRDASEGALYNAAAKLLEESTVLQRVAALLRDAQNASHTYPDELLRRADHARQRAARIQEIARED